MTLVEDLKWRGLIKDITSPDLEEKLNNGGMTFYIGTDPTGDSLHIGHYSSLVTAKRLANAGHKPILLVGGATGLIGDPRPTAEREIISYEKLNENKEKLKKQVKKLVGENVEVVDNYDWTKEFDYITFLRDIGKYINVNYMLNKDIIARRLESGITYAEFSYTLIQGNDFLHLFENKNCSMQVAGSDQWGNITTGIDLIRKKTGKEAYGFTMPLVLDANGNKFGKSEGNALWLDIEKTSSYELYQYLINASDELVEDYLKIFTFFTKEEIENIMKKHLEHPELRTAQKTLGHEIVKDIHGLEEANRAVKISEALFSGNVKDLTEKEINDVFKGAPSIEIEGEMTLLDLLVNNNIASSRREAREFLRAGSITINGDKFQDESQMITKDLAIGGHTMIIRRGKKKQFVVKFK